MSGRVVDLSAPKELARESWRIQGDPIRASWHEFHKLRHITTDHDWDYVDYNGDGGQGRYGFTKDGGEIICEMMDSTAMKRRAMLIAAAPWMLRVMLKMDLALHWGDERGPCLCSQCERRREVACILTALGAEGLV